MASPDPHSPQWRSTPTVWTWPPEEPSVYRLRDRLSDMFHGWRDGRRKILLLSQVPDGPGKGPSSAAGPGPGPAGEPSPAGSTGAGLRTGRASEAVSGTTPEVAISTPRIMVLGSEALEAIAREELLLEKSRAPLILQLEEARAVQDALPEKIRLAADALLVAQQVQPVEDQTRRRTAEQNDRQRPHSLILSRRRGEHSRRLAKAERDYLALTERHAEAIRTAEALAEIIGHRTAAAQAAARRDHERGQRRIATYLQQLVRSRKPDDLHLNTLILRHPVGPDLPEWVRGPIPIEPETDETGPDQ
jgi:hypothetical protein